MGRHVKEAGSKKSDCDYYAVSVLANKFWSEFIENTLTFVIARSQEEALGIVAKQFEKQFPQESWRVKYLIAKCPGQDE